MVQNRFDTFDSETLAQWQMKSGNYPISIRTIIIASLKKEVHGSFRWNHDSTHLIVILRFL